MLISFNAVLRGVFVGFFTSVTASKEAIAPAIHKVIDLLSDLKDQVEREVNVEAAEYEKFARFCNNSAALKSQSIATGQDKLESTLSIVQEQEAEKASKFSMLQEEHAKLERNIALVKTTAAQLGNEESKYVATRMDLAKAVMALRNALQTFQESRRPKAASDALESAATPIAAMNVRTGQAVLQLLGRASNIQAQPDYGFLSQSILEHLDELLKMFTTKLSEVDAQWVHDRSALLEKQTSLEAKLSENKLNVKLLEESVASLAPLVSELRGTLTGAQDSLTEDRQYLSTFLDVCETRAKEHALRISHRNKELQAISQAKHILASRFGSSGRARSAVQLSWRSNVATTRSHGTLLSLFQRDAAHAGVGGSSAVRVHDKSGGDETVEKVLELFHTRGKKLRSKALASIAAHLTTDPFSNLKHLIQELIERLLKDAAAEATQKAFCDAELKRAEQEKQIRSMDVQRAQAELAELSAQKDSSEEAISERKEDIAEIQRQLKDSARLRLEERAQNLQSQRDARQEISAVSNALDILRTFYKQYDKPVAKEADGDVSSGGKAKRQSDFSGIIVLLEVIKSDIEHSLNVTAIREQRAAEQFADFQRTSKVDVAAKMQQIKLDNEDLHITERRILQKRQDVHMTTELTEGAQKEFDALKVFCLGPRRSHEARNVQRDEEIKLLKHAMCMMESDPIEGKCG